MSDTTVTLTTIQYTTVTIYPSTTTTLFSSLMAPTTVTTTATTTLAPVTVTTTMLAPTTVTTTATQTLAPTTVTTTATQTLAPTTVTATATQTLAPTTVTATTTQTLAPTTVTTTQPPITAVTTVTQPTTITQVVATTVTAMPDNTIVPANLTVDSTVQLTASRTFELTGSIQPKSDVAQIEFYAEVDGQTRDLGAATLNKDGTFDFSDHVSKGTQGFITAVATDSAGRTSSAMASFSLAGNRQDRYDPMTGDYTGSTVFNSDGSKNITSVAADGTPLLTVHVRADGSSTTKIQASGQTVNSSSFDRFKNNGQPETTFVFNPGFGRDTIDLFRVDGNDHDTLSFKGSDYGNSVATVLNNSKDTAAGLLLTDPTASSSGDGPGNHDTLLLKGVTKDQLTQNQEDIKFHT